MKMNEILRKIYDIEFGFTGNPNSPIFIRVKNELNQNLNSNNLIMSKNDFDIIKKEANSERYLNLTGMGYSLSNGFESLLQESKGRIFREKDADDFKRKFILESSINKFNTKDGIDNYEFINVRMTEQGRDYIRNINKNKKDWIKFWIPVTISTVALIVSILVAIFK